MTIIVNDLAERRRSAAVRVVSRVAAGPAVVVDRHLDSIMSSHHDDSMRTTVTLDEDTERMIRDAMRRTQRSFKVTLNEAIRNGLNRVSERRPAFRVRARPMGLRTGIDPARMHEHEQEAEEERFLRVTDRAKSAAR